MRFRKQCGFAVSDFKYLRGDVMLKVLRVVKDTFFSRKFLAFCILGIFNTFNTAAFSWLGHFFLQDNLAAVFGYLISLTLAFLLNCKIIFRSKPKIKGYIRFLISYIPSFIIYFLLTFLTINTLNIPQFWATVIAVAAGGPVTFVIIKIYAFGQSELKSPYNNKK